MSKEEEKVRDDLEKLFKSEQKDTEEIIIDDTHGKNIDELCSKCENIHPKAIVIDRFQLVSESESEKYTRIEELDSIANKLNKLEKNECINHIREGDFKTSATEKPTW